MTAEQKRKMAAIYKLHKQLLLAINVLDSDVQFASKQWQQDKSNQFWARTNIRCFCASVEGLLSVLKNVTPETANYFNVTLSEKELELITERRKKIKDGIVREVPSYSPFPERVKEAFKFFLKAHAVDTSIDYNDSRFNDLCGAFELRNKLMHPRGVFDLEVNEESMQSAVRGQRWFAHALKIVLEICAETTPFQNLTISALI